MYISNHVSAEHSAAPVMTSLHLSESYLNKNLGVLFLGAVFSSMIYGLTCLQTFSYFRSPRAANDGRWLHLLVGMVLILDSSHQALVIHQTYTYLVLDFANPSKIETTLIWSGPLEINVNGILALLFNAFNLYRLWCLSGNRYLVSFGVFTCTARFGLNLSFGIRIFQYRSVAAAAVALKHHILALLSYGSAVDTLISGVLCYYLWMSRTGVRRSNDIISKLITMTITTGALCALWILGNLIVYVTAPHTMLDLFFTFIMSKFYANALLTTLNMREYFREVGERNTTCNTFNLTTINSSQGIHRPQLSDRTPAFVVHIQEESSTHSDGAQSESKPREPVVEDV
ncbi:hypothetical protein C8Q74DRAFT_1278517 [Fomes fomentarius]|nr:hypothetical protein C8Q74DRAFT_1278517 [Fomes fomentarius]